jgi:hypothetical protein
MFNDAFISLFVALEEMIHFKQRKVNMIDGTKTEIGEDLLKRKFKLN